MELHGWSTASTKLAAAFGGLGFIISSRETEIVEKNGKINLRHFVSQHSQWRDIDRDWLRNAWGTGELAQADPEHPFLVGMAAVHNYDWLCRYMKAGTRIRLVLSNGLWKYEQGEEDPRLRMSRKVVGLRRDLALAAALGVVGIPVIDLNGPDGQRTFVLPDVGHRSLTGIALPEWETAHLIKRREPGQLDLLLETTHPEHPLCSAYQTAYTYGKMNAHVKRLQREAGRHIILKARKTIRRAYISEDASDHILDQVRAHFRLPPPPPS